MLRKSFLGTIVFLSLFAIFGCAAPTEYVKEVLGVSVHSLKNRKEGRYSIFCNSRYSECYGKVLSIIKGMDAEIFVANEKKYCIGASKFNLVFPHCLDATEVGIFFEIKGAAGTKIDVVSRNSGLSEFVYEEIASNFNS